MNSIQQQLIVLPSIDSTNNYAMARIRAGLAQHKMAWFAHEQTAGKGQRGKRWLAEPGANIMMSIVLEPARLKHPSPVTFNMAIALACNQFFSRYAGDETSTKWPNDIYWRDRKAGGILIENIFAGGGWSWAIAGIGININQVAFSPAALNPVSLKQITGRDWDTVALAGELCNDIEHWLGLLAEGNAAEVFRRYNEHLFGLGRQVRLREGSRSFEAKILGVDAEGRLRTQAAIEETWTAGQISWELSS